MKKSNLLKKAVSVLLVASALAGCGSSASQTATTAAPAAAGTETSEAATEAASSESSAEPGTITMAMVSAWDSIIPFDTTSSYSDAVLDLIYDKLVYLKQDGTYEPRLADKWSMSDDNKVLTVHLNENAKWQDGEPVTADDVVFTMQVYNSPSAAVVRQNNVSPFAGFKEGDDSLQVKAVDEHTVEMTCAEPTNMDFLFFIKFRDIYILPKHLLGDTPYADIRNNSYWEKPIGSGPCIYESQISGERMEFKANKDYYLKTPQWDRFVVKVVATPSLLSGLMNDEIDILAGNVASLQLSDWDMAQQQQNLTCVSTESVGYQYMAINTEKDYLPPKVRQAIDMAINRDAIVSGLLKGEGEPAFGPFATSHKYYDDVVNVGYNPEKAKELLAEAGYPDGFEVTFDAPNDRYMNDEQIAQAVAGYLEKVGIKVNLNLMPKANFFSYIKPLENKSMFLMTGWSDASGDGLSLMHDMLYTYDREAGNGGVNRGHYSNAQVDALIDQAFTEMDDTKRGELVAEADKIAREDYAYIPLHFEQDTYAIKDTLNYTPRMNKYVYAWEFSYK